MNGNKSDCGASTSWQTGIELDSTKTFKWSIKNLNVICSNGNSRLIDDQKIEVKVDATATMPAMTLALSQNISYCDDDDIDLTVLKVNFECRTEGGTPIPTYVAKLSYIDKDDGSSKTHTATQNTQTYGSWRIGSKHEHEDGWNVFVRECSGAILLKFTWEFYRNIDVGNALTFSAGDSWNECHEHSKKQELLEMLNTGRFSDVKLVSCDGQEFQAHKFILKAGSEVFEAMFRHQMTESATGVITLGDLSARVVKFLLHFLYSSEILPISTSIDEDDDQNGNNPTFEKVFYLASKYGLKNLATHLEEDIGNFCGKEGNVLHLLRLCKLYSLEKGKEIIFDVVRNNRWNVLHDLVFFQL